MPLPLSALLLALLHEIPDAFGVGTDLSLNALRTARANAVALGLADRAVFVVCSYAAALRGPFDLIVSNPPYIAEGEMPDLAPEVRDWEPLLALSPGGDGLDGYRAIARGAGARLLPGGRLLVEIGPTQAAAVAALFAAAGLERVRVLPDLDGRDRVVVAVKPEAADRCGCA